MTLLAFEVSCPASGAQRRGRLPAIDVAVPPIGASGSAGQGVGSLRPAVVARTLSRAEGVATHAQEGWGAVRVGILDILGPPSDHPADIGYSCC